MKPDGNTRIYLCGVGGQGSVTAGRLLGEAAMAAGLPVTVSEVHGMSQRGGVVECCVLIGGARSPLIGRGDADALVAFEPLEALRALPFCSGRTVVVVNRRPIVPFTVSIGQGVYPEVETMLAEIAAAVGRLIALDAAGLAEQAGNAHAVNAVLLGALARSGALPLGEEAVRRAAVESVPAKFRETNARAFALGADAIGKINN
jgi:indolepyruvate ferredoxin oxidoreductase beta subunit